MLNNIKYIYTYCNVINIHNYSLKNMFYLYFLYHNAGNYINFSTRRENIRIKPFRVVLFQIHNNLLSNKNST